MIRPNSGGEFYFRRDMYVEWESNIWIVLFGLDWTFGEKWKKRNGVGMKFLGNPFFGRCSCIGMNIGDYAR